MSSRSVTPDNGMAAESDFVKTPTRNSTSRGIRESSSGRDVPPSTQRKADTRRRYGVRITDEPSGTATADASDSFDESEVELQRVRNDISRSADTTHGDVSVNDSGAAAAAVRQAISRRSAAGISLKDSEARIKKLEAENNELRIECDLLRQHMRPDEAQLKLVSISNELARLRRSNAEYGRLLKQQDSSLKESKRMWKKWGHLDPEKETQRRGELEIQLAEALASVERESRARQLAEEELDLARDATRNSDSADEGQIARLQQMLQEQREDHEDELQALQEELQKERDTAKQSADSDEMNDLRDELDDVERQLVTKETENEELMARIDDLEHDKARQETELEDIRAELQQVQAADDSHTRELEVAQRRLEHIAADNEDEEERIHLAQQEVTDRLGPQVDRLRDELAQARLEVRTKDQQIDELSQQREEDDVRLQELETELERAANAIEERNEEIEQLVAEGDEQEEKLRKADVELSELALDVEVLQNEVNEKDAEIGEVNQELKALSYKLEVAEEDVEALKQDVAALEGENREISEQLRELRERSERRELAYKERLGQAEQLKIEIQSQMDAIEKDYQNAAEDSRVLGRDVDSLQQERKDLQQQLETAYQKLEAAVEDLKDEERKREEAEETLERNAKSYAKELRALREEREASVARLERERDSLAQGLADSKSDVDKLQDALRNKEDESVQLGRSHTNDRYSLELEIDRLKRDIGRCEEDLERVRRELEGKDEVLRDKETKLDAVHLEALTLSSQLAAESQTRKGLEERMESQRKAVAEAQREQDLRTTLQAESQTKTQLTERNNLLMSVYQTMGKLLGSTSTPRKRGEMDVKPFTNFFLFHDSLVARLRRLVELQTTFEQRAKTIEAGFTEKMTMLKRQQESRFRQLDRLEVSLKNAAEKHTQWRGRLVSKQSEIEALKATSSELHQQIASLRTRSSLSSPADASKINALNARANNAERRLNAALNQSVMAEERLSEAKSKYAEGEGKWAARIKELESRCKAAEERVKRERLGAKERVSELEEEVARIRKSLEGEQRRVKVLEGLAS